MNEKTEKTARVRRRPKSIPFGMRFLETTAKILRLKARKEKCYAADVVRTAVDEYIERNNLAEEFGVK